MRFFDRIRERQEARETLARHYAKQRRWVHSAEWTTAERMLGTVYTREDASRSPSSASQRVKYLAVAEPEPVYEDYLPRDFSGVTQGDPVVVLRATQARFDEARRKYALREQAREAELQYARKALEVVTAQTQQAHIEASRERWSQYTNITDEIAALPFCGQQVDAQNDEIEQRMRRLSQVLITGVGELSLPISTHASSQQCDVDAPRVARDALYQLQRVALMVDELDIDERFRVAYTSESRQLVIECELPDASVVPAAKHYRYIQSRDAITETARPVSQIKAAYAETIAQTALVYLATAFATDQHNAIDVAVLNGMVDTIDPRSGRRVRPCLLTVRVTRERFAELDLKHVDAQACLRHLSARVSPSPTELLPVKPVLEFDMVDSRFVEAGDAVSILDDRPNLLELTPTEFESLIQNLFSSMGLETKQTRASRDGGVDCIAYDTRPIFGGKVVIQAKRYKNTVGVSAVRDLFGTLQNEGASKGILVTTSGYGSASYDFAANKPLELIEGTNLLYLLEHYMDVRARIEAPQNWCDPVPDSPDHA